MAAKVDSLVGEPDLLGLVQAWRARFHYINY